MPKAPITDNVVPFSGAPAGPMPSETDFAMAAATMHAQGRLFAQSAPQLPEMSAEDSTKTWERSPEISEGFPYHPTNRDEVMKQLNSNGEAIIRKDSKAFQEFNNNPSPDYDMREMNTDAMSKGLSKEQRDWMDQHGRLIYIKRKPLVS